MTNILVVSVSIFYAGLLTWVAYVGVGTKYDAKG